jgi:hypothetical protein
MYLPTKYATKIIGSQPRKILRKKPSKVGKQEREREKERARLAASALAEL